jgi:hypothetical protein
MENNEEVLEETQEQTTGTDTEQVETQEEGQEETKDWKAEALKYKAIAERKEKKLQEQPKKVDNKSKTSNDGLTREEAFLVAKGASLEDLEIASKVAKLEGINLMEAWADDYVQSQVEKRQKAEAAERAQLGASGGSPTSSGKPQKSPGKMTREEHEAYMRKRISGQV